MATISAPALDLTALGIGLVIYAFYGYRNSALRTSTTAPEPQQP